MSFSFIEKNYGIKFQSGKKMIILKGKYIPPLEELREFFPLFYHSRWSEEIGIALKSWGKKK
jgi:hypothetical protein